MTPHASVTHRSQLVAYPFFVAAAFLFLLQVLFGLLIAAQYVWPTFLMNTLPFNFGRASHLNLLVFWLLLGLMGASYYLVCRLLLEKKKHKNKNQIHKSHSIYRYKADCNRH